MLYLKSHVRASLRRNTAPFTEKEAAFSQLRGQIFYFGAQSFRRCGPLPPVYEETSRMITPSSHIYRNLGLPPPL